MAQLTRFLIATLALIGSATAADLVTLPGQPSIAPAPYFQDGTGTSGDCSSCAIGKGGQCYNVYPPPAPPVLQPGLSSNKDYATMMAIREALPTLAALPGFQSNNPCDWTYASYSNFVFCSIGDSDVRIQSLNFYGDYGFPEDVNVSVPFPLDLITGLDALTSISIIGTGPSGFTGVLPESWAKAFVNLTGITLSNNSFSGPIPDSWATAGAFPKLSYLWLDSNKFTGTLPKWGIASLPELTTLSLQDNSFSGSLPESWVSLANLSTLQVADNRLTGTLPSSFGGPESFGQLGNINISKNSFSGTLPESWGSSEAFRRRSPNANYTAPSLTLALNDNPDLSGSIPAAWTDSGLLTYGQTTTVYVAPGTALCGSPPPYINALAVNFSNNDVTSDFSRASLPDCAVAPAASASG